MKEKVVLAYSGGLDTTTIIPWLKEKFDYEVVCCCIDCGQGNELDAIAAVIIGGAAMSGGSGTILGTILGSAILGVLNNGLSLLNVNSYLMQVITGTVVILASLIDKVRGALTRRSAVMKSRESLLRETREQKEADT